MRLRPLANRGDELPAAWKTGALAHRETLRFLRGLDDLDWVYLCRPR